MNVAITGYYGTGSSAVLDLLCEYEGCSEGGRHSYEHVPLYYPDGLFDLEYKLLWGNDPHRSDEAIKSFREAMYRLNEENYVWFGSYKANYGGQFQEIVDRFLDRIVQFRCEGEWYNYYEQGGIDPVKYLKDCVKTLLPGREVNGAFGRKPPRPVKREMELSFLPEEAFYQYAKAFVREYCAMINQEKAPVLLLDHLLFPHNAYKVEKFFDEDFRLIIVERDIRDMFVLCKYVWTKMGFTSPYPTDAETFLKHWSNMRNAERRTDDGRVMHVRFEDLVYRYDDTVKRIEDFVGLAPEQHLRPRSRFDPDRSINNTQNFRIQDDWRKEVEIFEGRSNDIYPFPYVRKTSIDQTFDN